MRRRVFLLAPFLLATVLPLAEGRIANAAPVPTSACTAFPADNVWNADVSTLPVHPRSNQWLSSMAASTTNLHPDFGGPPYGFPFNVVDNSHPTTTVAFQYASE